MTTKWKYEKKMRKKKLWNIIIVTKVFMNENMVRALTMKDFCHPRLRLHFIVVLKPYIYFKPYCRPNEKMASASNNYMIFY